MNCWVQLRGEMYRDGQFIGSGYSGHGLGINNPNLQHERSVGPIPCGKWRIAELLEHTDSHGPYVLRLEPEPGTETFGRAGFLVHGDLLNAAAHPNEASLGCIILGPGIRKAIWESGDRELTVVAKTEDMPQVC